MTRHRRCWLAWLTAFALLALTAALLYLEGRRWWCACGQWYPLSSDAYGPHNSQHLFDPYSLTHVVHGFLICGAVALIAPRLALSWRVGIAVLVECVWEIIENSEAVIERYRTTTAALGYTGDSIANSIGDVISGALGCWLAARLGLWRTVAVGLAVEVLLLVWIRDNLFLNVLMLLFPLPAVRDWQTVIS